MCKDANGLLNEICLGGLCSRIELVTMMMMVRGNNYTGKGKRRSGRTIPIWM